MKSKIKGIIMLFIIIIAARYYSVIDKNQPIYNSKCDSSEYLALELTQNSSISEQFICKEDTINGLSFKMNENAGTVTESLVLTYELWDVSEEKCLLKDDTDINELKSGKFFEIRFDPITECKNKEYIFTVTIKKCEGQNGINVYYTQGEEENTELVYNNDNMNGTWVLRTITHRFDIETFVVTLCFVLYIILFMKALYRLFE